MVFLSRSPFFWTLGSLILLSSLSVDAFVQSSQRNVPFSALKSTVQAEPSTLDVHDTTVNDQIINDASLDIDVTSTLQSLLKSKTVEAAEKSEQIVWRLQQAGKLTQKQYALAIQAVIKKSCGADDQAEVVAQAEALYQQAHAKGIELDVYLQSSLLDAYASCSCAKGAEKAESMLEQMEEAGIANDVVYNTVLKAWKCSNSPQAPTKAEAILKRMEELALANTISYTTLIGVLANKGDTASAKRANEILEGMHTRYEQGEQNVKPNKQTYNSVIHTWVQCGNVQRAEQVLRRMEQLELEGETELAPSVVSYSTVISGWAKSGGKDAMEKAEEIFDKMMAAYEAGNEECLPNLYCYVNLINAYVKSRDANGAQKAEDTLFRMYNEYKKGNSELKPNAQLVTLVIDCWRKSGARDAGEKAEALLNWMIEQDGDLMPNEFTFSSAIAAWSRSRKFGKALRAHKILKRMMELHECGRLSARPNAHCYTAVINSCAYCENDEVEKQHALKIAISTYKELTNSGHTRPNPVTFATLLTALRNLLPQGKERSSAVLTVFKNAAKDGYVNDMVVRRVQSALTTEELRALFSSAVQQDGNVRIDLLPTEWRRNASS